jgi:hypothetical protein
MFGVMGFGRPLDDIPMLLQPGVLSLAWGSVVRQLAAGLGISLDEVTETYVREPAPRTSTSHPAASIRAPPPHCDLRCAGWSTVTPVVVLEHVTRLRNDLCPEWPQPAQEGGSYRIEITGEPSYAMDLCLSSPNGDHNHAGLGRDSGAGRQRDPRRGGCPAGSEDDARLAPDHRERVVRWR